MTIRDWVDRTAGVCFKSRRKVKTGIPVEYSTAHVFGGFDDLPERFVEFWELISKERVLDGNISNVLLGLPPEETVGRCLRNNLSEPDYRLGRNALYDHIEPAVAIVLSDEALLHDRDSLSLRLVQFPPAGSLQGARKHHE